MYNDSNSLHFKISSWVIISIDSMYILTSSYKKKEDNYDYDKYDEDDSDGDDK